jgi:hypothetical protein
MKRTLIVVAIAALAYIAGMGAGAYIGYNFGTGDANTLSAIRGR